MEGIKIFFQFDYSKNVPKLAESYGFIPKPLEFNPDLTNRIFVLVSCFHDLISA